MDPMSVTLLILLPLVLARYRHSWSSATPGTVVVTVRLSWRERLRLQVDALVGGAGLVLIDAALRGPRVITFGLLGSCLLLSVAVPLHYTVTDQGFQLGRSRFRRWTEFAGLSTSRGRIRLQPVSGGRRMTRRLSDTAAAELEPVLRRQIWTAYRGTEPMVERPGPGSASASPEPMPALPAVRRSSA